MARRRPLRRSVTTGESLCIECFADASLMVISRLYIFEDVVLVNVSLCRAHVYAQQRAYQR